MCPSKLVNSSPIPYHTRVVTPDGAGKIINYDPYHGYYTVQLDGTPDESCVEEYYPSQVSVETPLDVTAKKTLSSCKVGDAVLTDHGKGTVIANDYDQNGNYCKVLLESGEVIYTTDIYEKISPKIYPLDATGRTISRGDLVQCINSNVQGRVTNISYISNIWYCSFVHDNDIAIALAAYRSQNLRIVEESPEEKGPEQMFPEQKNPEEKSPAPKFKVGDRVLTLNYGMCTICRYDKHSNTYDVVDDFGYVRGDFREKELTCAGTCTTPEEQKETSQKETSSPKKKFEVGEKVVVATPKYGGKFDGTILDIQIKDDTYYLVRYDYPQGVYLLPEHRYLKAKNLEKKEMSCCKETHVQNPEQTPLTEIWLQDAYERIRRELERNPIYRKVWEEKLLSVINDDIGSDFTLDDIQKIIRLVFKVKFEGSSSFEDFHPI